jgi:hypothetical protein
MVESNIKNSFIRIPPTVGNRGLPAHKAIVIIGFPILKMEMFIERMDQRLNI